MGQGVPQHLDHGFVQFRLLAGYGQVHLPATALGQVPHHAVEPVEEGPDGDHTDLHHVVLQLAGNAVQVAQGI